MWSKRAGAQPLLLPVRRRLAVVCLSALAGIYLAKWRAVNPVEAILLCAFCVLWGGICRARRKSALFCMMAFVFLAGNARTGALLAQRDAPTRPGVAISGTVTAIERPGRVYLSDVTADGGQRLEHAVLVTLMTQDGDGSEESVRVGQHIRGTGRLFAQEEVRNPGGVDRRIAALCGGYELSGYILPGWEAEGEAAFSVREAFRVLREALLSRMERIFGEHAPLFEAVLLGDRGAMDADVVAAMRLTGTVHILTVSGLHLSLMAMLADRLFKRMHMRRWGKFAAKAALLGFFTGLTGCAAGTVRACLMAMIRSLAVCRGKRYEPLTALAAAALVMTAYNPLVALSASFQFSFFVVLGILLLESGVSAWLDRHTRRSGWLRPLGSMLAVGVSAQAAAVPMQLLLYGYMPLLALPMNLASGMVTPAVMLGGWLCMALGAVAPGLGQACAGIAALPGEAFEALSVAAAQSGGGILRLPAPYAVSLVGVAAAMALMSRRMAFGRGRRRALLLVLFALIVGYAPRFCPASRYVQLDVGQGDAAVVRRGRQAVLVDVGPADSYDALRYLRHEGLFADTVVLSHLDEDHAGALLTLLRSEVKIGAVVMAEDAWKDASSAKVTAALELAREKGVPVRTCSRGDLIETAVVSFEVLSPDGSQEGSNERSLLLYARMEEVGLLLTGDLPASCEPGHVPDCDVLKVAHHGSKNATSDAFLAEASPRLALISVGAGNGYGHPTQRVLDSLAAIGADVLRTDRSGCVTLWLRDGTIRVRTMINPKAPS